MAWPDPDIYLDSPSPRLEEKILKVIQKDKEGLDRVNNAVKKDFCRRDVGCRLLLDIICSHFSTILTML